MTVSSELPTHSRKPIKHHFGVWIDDYDLQRAYIEKMKDDAAGFSVEFEVSYTVYEVSICIWFMQT